MRIMRAGFVGFGLLLVWQLAVWALNLPVFLLPGPMQVLQTLWLSRGMIGAAALVTLGEVVLSLVIGCVLGAATALCLAAWPRMQGAARPLLILSQTIPIFALAPLLTLWLGYGLASKITVAVLVIYFPVTSAFLDALNLTPPGWLQLARVMQARPAQTLWRIRVPAALPGLASGLRLAAIYAPLGVVLGEWVGAAQGLGYLMLLANGRAKIDLMFAALLVLCAITYGLHRAVEAALVIGLKGRV
jgi:putative hydroxymethylpyrimidine transport system permease protein